MPHLLPKMLGNCKDGTWTKAQVLASLRAFPNGLDRIIAFKGFWIHFGHILFIFELLLMIRLSASGSLSSAPPSHFLVRPKT